MKKSFYIFIIIIFSLSCSKDCARRIDNMKMFPVVNTETSEQSQVKGWYHSEFQNGLLNFTLEFRHTGAGDMCKYYWANYPDQNSIELYANKELIRNLDTIKPGQLLNEFFTTQKEESENYFISFLITEKANSEINYTHEFYTFTAKITTDKNEIFIDSCIVKKK